MLFYELYSVSLIINAQPVENPPMGMQVINRSKARHIVDPPFL